MEGIIQFTKREKVELDITESNEREQHITLGSALSIIWNSDEKDFNVAESAISAPLSSINGKSELIVVAIRTLYKSLASSPKTLSQVLIPCIERVVEDKRGEKRKKVYRAFKMMHNWNAKESTQKITEILHSKDKRHKLGGILLMSLFLQDLLASISISLLPTPTKPSIIEELDSNEENEKKKKRIGEQLVHNVLISSQLLEPLLKCVKEDGVQDGIKTVPTRLTTSASDLTLRIGYALALCAEEGEVDCEDKLWDNLHLFLMLHEQLVKWFADHRPMFVIAIKELVGIFKSLMNLKEQLQEREHNEDANTEAMKAIKDAKTILRYTCTLFFQYVMEDNEIVFKNMYKELLSLFAELQDPFDPKYPEGFDDSPSYNSLICISLILGKLNNKQFNEVVKHIQQHIYNSLTRQLRSKNQKIQTLAVQLLQRVVLLSASEDSARELVDPLLMLLNERDAASKAVIGFVAEFASRYPVHILDQIFSNLDATDSMQRQNALDILSEVFRINREATQHNADLSKRLAVNLLKRLYDEQLTLRTQAASLFAILEPDFIVPELARLTYHRDARVRSAADVALLSLMSSHKDVSGTIEVLLECIRQGAPQPQMQYVPMSPADIGASSPASFATPASIVQTPGHIGINPTPPSTPSDKMESDLADRVLRVVPKWADELPTAVWPDIITTLLKKLFAYPQDAVMIKFAAKIGKHASQFPQVLLPPIIERMKTQQGLTEEILESQSEESSKLVQSLIFERLRPLLLLRVLPANIFQITANANFLKELIELLMIRMTQLYEYEEVRKLSAEVIAKFAPSLVTAQLLQHFTNYLKEKSFVFARVFLFSLCNLLLQHGRELEPFNIHQVIPALLNILKMHPSGQDTQKLQHGAIDCLALLLKTSLSTCTEFSMNNVSEEVQSIDDLLPVLLALTSAPTSTQNKSVQICIINVFITAAKMLPLSSLDILLKCSFKPFMKLLHHKQTDAVIKAAVLQVLFSISYHLKEGVASYAMDMFQVSLEFLNANDYQCRLNALKLLGILMGSNETLLDDVTTLSKVQSLLEGIANIDPYPEARQLAEKYLSLFNPQPKV